jgi:hypothetical protein
MNSPRIVYSPSFVTVRATLYDVSNGSWSYQLNSMIVPYMVADLNTQPVPVSCHFVDSSHINLRDQLGHHGLSEKERTSLTHPLLSFVNWPARKDMTELLNWKS